MDNMGCENIHKDDVHHKGLAGHPTHKKSEGPCHQGPRIVVMRIPWPFWWIHDEYVDDTPLEAPRAMALPPLQEVYASLNTSVSNSFGEQGSPQNPSLSKHCWCQKHSIPMHKHTNSLYSSRNILGIWYWFVIVFSLTGQL
jgi:hypothetical protein